MFEMQHNKKIKVRIGNGTCMPIVYIGTTKYTSSHTNTDFILRNLFHVPHITKNLLSVSQFAKDDNVYFEFFS